MQYRLRATALAVACAWLCATPALADHAVRADDHAPIGVMGDHFHSKGEWMFSYRFMSMSMADNRDGEDDITPEEIVTTAANPFFGAPMQPPTLRVVPVEMTMDMHMFGAMYAPSDRVTLMGMVNYVDKVMDHVTFAGPSGTDRLGSFRTSASGIGDTRLSALVSLRHTETDRWHLTIGASLPTGDTDETGQVLAPTGMQPTLRLPYPMQLGSGTYDVLGGLTYAGFADRFSWGAQWSGVFRTGDDNGYTLGNEHRIGGWGAWLVRPVLSLSARLEYFDRGNIDGMDPRIMAPVQTADPNRQGVKRLDLGLGANLAGTGSWRGHRLGIEFLYPLEQDLDGPQLETDWTATIGYQYAF
ncbi:MAG: transporter [Pseudomonadota bacterium]